MNNFVISDWETIDISSTEVAITNYNGGETKTVEVPSTIGSKTVIAVISENNLPVFAVDDCIEKIIFPKTIKELSGCICQDTTALVFFEVEEGGTFVSKDGVIFTADEEILVLFPSNRSGSYSIPYKTKVIGQYAFFGSCLSEVICSESMETISDYAFLNARINNINLKKITSIANNAFAGCIELQKFEVGKSEKFFTEDGVIYNHDVTELLLFPANKDLVNGLFLIPETVERVSEYAFSSVKNIEIRCSRRMKKISAYAFQNAENIIITIYRDLNDFNHNAFKNASGTIKTNNEEVKNYFESQRILYGEDSISVVENNDIEYFDRGLSKAEHKSRMDQAARDFLLNEKNGDSDNIKLKRNLIEEFPWGARFERIPINIERVSNVFKEKIYGLEKAKRQFLRWLALYNRTPEVPIRPILFIGPQGCGKTMMGEIFAKAIDKPLEFVSIPSIEAGWVLSGSNQTWRDASCGKIIQSIINFGEYPVFLFDEVDKAGLGGQYASPQYILLNLLDQNTRSKFRDAFFDIPIDLSTAFIILTANDKTKIVPFLLDRCYIVELEPITKHEDKRNMLTDYILPKLYELYKLTTDEFYPFDEIINILIQDSDSATNSVRDIERRTEILLQEIILLLAEGKQPNQLITSQYIKDILEK